MFYFVNIILALFGVIIYSLSWEYEINMARCRVKRELKPMRKKWINRWARLAAIIGTVAMYVTALPCHATGAGEATVKFGVILPMTGSLAILGQNESQVLRASEKVINNARADKRKVELVIEDAAGDPKKAATIANLFATKNIPIVISSTTSLSAPVVPINEQNGRLSVVHSMTESLLKDTKLAVRIYPGIQDEVQTIGEWLSKPSLKVSIFVLRMDAEWSMKWVDSFRKSWPKIQLIDEIYGMQNPNVRNALAKIESVQATHILLLGFGQEYPVILRQIKEAGITLPILGNIAFSYAGTRQKVDQAEDRALLRGCVFPFVDIDTQAPEFIRLREVLQSSYRMDILHEPGALYYYDTLKMLLEAIDNVGLDPAALRQYILDKEKTYHGITGLIEMNPDGNSSIRLKMAHYGDDATIQFLADDEKKRSE